jgi:formylmethanofuran dehydrogenase subunit E
LPSTTEKKGGSAMPWIIKAYIPVESEDPEVYATKEDAEKDLESLSLMQPENIYEIQEVEET